MAPILIALLLVCALCLACGTSNERLLVFAASSLTDPMQQLAEMYEKQTGVRVDLSFGASGRLAQQIIRGAPADVLISAGGQPVDRLEGERLLAEGSRRPLLTNRLVLAVRSGDAGVFSSLEELAETGEMLAIADPDLAPAGLYAKEALTHLGLWETFEPRLVYGANVRTTLGYVESGNVAAALVYRTDPAVSDGVIVVETLPEEYHSPIVYPAVVLISSTKQESAAAFIEFLWSRQTSQLFERMGFGDGTEDQYTAASSRPFMV